MRWNNPLAVSRLFDEMFNDMAERGQDYTWRPLANISEKDDRYELELAIPGMKKDEFNISVEKNMLTVTGERKEEKKEEHEEYTRREFVYGKFSRSFTLPESVDRDKIKADYNDGILRLQLPKTEKETLKRLVKVS